MVSDEVMDGLFMCQTGINENTHKTIFCERVTVICQFYFIKISNRYFIAFGNYSRLISEQRYVD